LCSGDDRIVVCCRKTTVYVTGFGTGVRDASHLAGHSLGLIRPARVPPRLSNVQKSGQDSLSLGHLYLDCLTQRLCTGKYNQGRRTQKMQPWRKVDVRLHLVALKLCVHTTRQAGYTCSSPPRSPLNSLRSSSFSFSSCSALDWISSMVSLAPTLNSSTSLTKRHRRSTTTKEAISSRIP